MKLKTKRVAIAGGCGCLGLATATAFAVAGARVDLIDIDLRAGQALAEKHPTLVKLHACDLALLDGIPQALSGVFEGDDAPDALIFAAGAPLAQDSKHSKLACEDMSITEWRQVMNVNLHSAFVLSGLALRPMLKRCAGRIVYIASDAARTGGGGAEPVHDVSAKAGLIGLTKVSAKEVGRQGITVNAINPGQIESPALAGLTDAARAGTIAKTPLRRLGTPQDIANTALYLCSDLADFVTGAVIEVNGGLYVGP